MACRVVSGWIASHVGICRAPLGVQSRQGTVLTAQPCPETRPPTRRQVEIPEGGQVGDAGFVAKRIIQRMERCLLPDRCDQPVANPRSPGRVKQRRLAEKCGSIIRSGTIPLLRGEKPPVHRPTRRVSMIRRIKIGGDVFDVPPHAEIRAARRFADPAVCRCHRDRPSPSPPSPQVRTRSSTALGYAAATR